MALKLSIFFCFVTAFEIGLIDAHRSDYSYIESTHSFYKYHQKKLNWTDARSVCQSEGAILFHPENEAEYFQVFSVLGVGKKLNVWSGIYLTQPGVCETIDGRPISQVYHDWWYGGGYLKIVEPNRTCGVFDVTDTRKLFLGQCVLFAPYICKLIPTMESIMLKTAVEQVNTVIVNASEKLTGALEGLAKKETTALEQFAEIMQQQIKVMQQQTEITRQQSANQSAALERQAASETAALEQSAKQTAALERLAQSVQHQEAMQQQAAAHDQNQTRALLERLASAQEKIATALHMLTSANNEDNVDLGSQQ